MITKNGILRPNKNSSLLTNSKPKSRPSKIEPSESEIDFSNVPTIQGTYKATKLIPAQNTSTINANSAKDDLRESSLTSPKVEDTTKPHQSTLQDTTTETVNQKTSQEIPDIDPNQITTVPSLSTTDPKLDEHHKDFIKPDFETSPWKPIIPTFINTDLKLLPEITQPFLKSQYNIDPTRMTNQFNQNVQNKEVTRGEELIVGTPISEVKPPDLFMNINQSQVIRPSIDPPGMSTFDTDESDFPHDRIVPQEMINFRVNGKFKNKLPAFQENSTVEAEDSKPEIEVSGQVPPETYQLRLKTSPDSIKEIEKSHLKDISFQGTSGVETEVLDKKPVSRFDDPSSFGTKPTTYPNFVTSELPVLLTKDSETYLTDKPISDFKEELPVRISGVGVAEPVSDFEIDLEARNRFSDIAAISNDSNLSDQKVNQVPQQPVYTSYKTPDLNGGAKPSLVENPGTLKPFRHTIPVDKITSAVDGDSAIEKAESSIKESESIINENGSQSTEVSPMSNLEVELSENKKIDTTKHILPDNPWIPDIQIKMQNQTKNRPLSNLEKIVAIETFVNDSEPHSTFKVNMPTENSNIELTEGPIKANAQASRNHSLSGNSLIIVNSPSLQNASENPSVLGNISKVDSLNTNEEKLLVLQSQLNSTKNMIKSSSRNSTFIEIDTLKHVPGQGQAAVGTIEEEPSLWFVENETLTSEPKKKTYNDTLRANVVENLVTLAPAKSNTGIRPIRPRPKVDKEKSTRLLEKISTSQSPIESLNEATLLDKLFNLQSSEKDFDKREFISLENETKMEKPMKQANGSVEQIIEVVTSISTKVSSSIQGNPVTLKLVVSNSSKPEGSQKTEIKIPEPGVKKSEIVETRAFQDENKPKAEMFTWVDDSTELKSMQTSDRKTSAGEENRVLLEQLKQLANVRTGNDPVTPQPKNNSSSKILNPHFDDLKSEIYKVLPNVDELKKIADVAAGNQTILKNSSSSFALSRDGVEVLTKVLTKVEDPNYKKISMSEENVVQSSGKRNIFFFSTLQIYFMSLILLYLEGLKSHTKTILPILLKILENIGLSKKYFPSFDSRYGVSGGISGTTNPIEQTERGLDRWHLRLHFCEESVVS